MGGWVTHIWWGGDPDTPDAVSGLSRRNVYSVRRSWNIMYADPVATGSELFKRYFRAYPEAKKFFRALEHIPEEEYPKNAQFKAHVLNLLGALNSAIENLHEPELAAALMKKIGETHRKRRVLTKNFDDMKEILVVMLVEMLKVDDMTLEAWTRAINFIYKNIFATLDP